ncbi:MAG TPA: methyltransferase domain-containing protein [Chloroflexota bacterium]|nr:methyltransferase domain-containing protein [Chloroflexota bacterium]
MGLLWYYLVVVTEGVFLGRRLVVWLYDRVAKTYDARKAVDPDFEAFFLARPLQHHLKQLPNPLILDVATGTGRLPVAILEEPLFHGRVIGLDASGKMLAVAAGKLRPYRHRAALVQQTADRLPFPTNCFDAATCLESLEFFPNDETAVCEMVRVLKPGGVLLVTRRKGAWGKAFLGRYRTVAQFEDFLRTAGLEKVYTMPWQQEYDQVYGRKPALPK